MGVVSGGGGSGGVAAPITRATYDLSVTSIPVNGALTKLPFAFNYGTALLDLTTPTDPTPHVSGTYSFAVRLTVADDEPLATRWQVVVTLDEDDFGAAVAASNVLTNAGTSLLAATLPFYVPAGSPCFVQASYTSGGAAHNVFGIVQLQRLS